ncbi:MAG TPA: transglutaminase domain-containing protein [Candidatus Omnitrophica bacterium]|nr:transglutaminase domain-containing protein [Candidatus Omnitrophota bacterium]
MKKRIIILSVVVILCMGIFMLLNIEVSIQQGINFQVRSIKMPLYLKVLDFFDRHYNYKNLVREIIEDSDSKPERIAKIFDWTHSNIKRVPEGVVIIDDHVWHIIVRRYGTNDQSADVFSTLCNYAGVEAFFDFIYADAGKGMMPLAFVKINNAWGVFDPYNGVYFKNRAGEFASIKEIKEGNCLLYAIGDTDKRFDDYARYLHNLPSFKDIGFKRANVQSPLRRLMYEASKAISKINKPDNNNEKD